MKVRIIAKKIVAIYGYDGLSGCGASPMREAELVDQELGTRYASSGIKMITRLHDAIWWEYRRRQRAAYRGSRPGDPYGHIW